MTDCLEGSCSIQLSYRTGMRRLVGRGVDISLAFVAVAKVVINLDSAKRRFGFCNLTL